MKNSSNRSKEPHDMKTSLTEIFRENEHEIIKRYNLLLPEFNKAMGAGIRSIYGQHYGSKESEFGFGELVQVLYRQTKGQPIEMKEEAHEEIAPISHDTRAAATTHSTPNHHSDDDNDASEFIARHAS